MNDIVIGCPVANRAWVLPKWFEHVFDACNEAVLMPHFVFVVPPGDRETKDVIRDSVARSSLRPYCEMLIDNTPPPPPVRRWNRQRFEQMVVLRNQLLKRVRQIGPSYFWSLDSDMLCHYRALAEAREVLDTKDCSAVGMHAYMSMVGREHGSKRQLIGEKSGNARVHDSELGNVYPADVVMASVLMGPKAYLVDYQMDLDGEDTGWAKACKAKGLRFMWAGNALCKHILEPEMLDREDWRVGF
jgi:hypothetical protein